MLVEKVDIFQYVPLIENLNWMLQNRDLCSEVYIFTCMCVLPCSSMYTGERPINQTEYLLDFCDGRLYKEHPVFQHDKNALQLVIYFDEVEVANPLVSYHGIHKLGTCIMNNTKVQNPRRELYIGTPPPV